MKLPTADYTRPVQSLGRRNVALAGAAGGLFLKGLSDALSKVNQAYGRIKDKEDQADQEKASYELSKSDAEWRAANDGKEAYTLDEIPDDVQIRRSNMSVDINTGEVIQTPRDSIPAWEVQPSMYKSYIDKKILELSQGISDSRLRERWQRKQSTTANNNWANRRVDAVEQRRADTIRTQKNQIDDAIDRGSYDVARELVNGYQGNPSDKGVFNRKINWAQETSAYDLALTRADKSGLQASLNRVQSEGYEGELSPRERRTYANQFRAALNSIGAREQEGLKVHAAMVNHEAATTISALKAGERVDPQEINNLRGKLTAIGTRGLEKLFDLETEAGTAEITNRFIVDYSEAERDQILAARRSNKESGSQAYVTAKMASANQKAKELLKKDPITYGERYGFTQVTSALPGPDLVVALQSRKIQHDMVLSKTGRTNGYLKADEVQVWVDTLERASIVDKMVIYGQVNEALGEEAKKFYDQLGTKSSDPSTYAGELFAEGDMQASRMVLEGNRARREIKGLTPEIQIMRTKIVGMMGQAYSSNSTRQGYVQSAVVDVYAHLSRMEGDDSGVMDNDRLEKAFEIVTGGLIQHSDIRFEPPERGMPQSAWDSWIDTLSPEYIVDLGGSSLKPERLMEMIKDDEVAMVSMGHNRYFLRHLDTNTYIAGADNRPFEFRYDADAPTVEESAATAGIRKFLGLGSAKQIGDPNRPPTEKEKEFYQFLERYRKMPEEKEEEYQERIKKLEGRMGEMIDELFTIERPRFKQWEGGSKPTPTEFSKWVEENIGAIRF